MTHLVREAIALGAVPVCPVHQVAAGTRGKKDPAKFGHIWRQDDEDVWCVHTVEALVEEERE